MEAAPRILLPNSIGVTCSAEERLGGQVGVAGGARQVRIGLRGLGTTWGGGRRGASPKFPAETTGRPPAALWPRRSDHARAPTPRPLRGC